MKKKDKLSVRILDFLWFVFVNKAFSTIYYDVLKLTTHGGNKVRYRLPRQHFIFMKKTYGKK
jgi:hypothetical protein